ncbi:MAG: flagellar biosynthesis anti-sigma factor FlgM [Planctomycetota bacterium]
MRVNDSLGLHGAGAPERRKGGAPSVGKGQPANAAPKAQAANAQGAGATADTVEMSAGAKALMSGGIAQKSEIRPEMVDRARKVIETGQYNDEAVLQKTAEKIATVISTQA